MSAAEERQTIRRSPTPATIACLVFLGLAMLRILVFRPELTQSPEALKETVTVRYVIDGDTFDLTDGRRIRMLGINAPEEGFGDKPREAHAAESTTWLRRRIEGHRVRLRIDSAKPDRYQRTLAWVYDLDGELLNAQMLREGQARLLDDFGLPLDLEPVLRAAESDARILRLGLWKSTARNRQVR